MKSGISVIIPVSDGERTIADAIDSVLAQTCPAHEVIVVDDGSSDRSAAIAADYGGIVKLVRQEAAGAGAARNRGVTSASGSHLAFLDADDLWLPRKSELQLRTLDEDPGLDMVYGGLEPFLDDPVRDGSRLCLPPAGPGLSLCTLLVRRASWLRVGPLREDLSAGEFIEWYDRARHTGLRGTVLTETVCRRRVHPDRLSRKKAARGAGYLEAVRHILARKVRVG
ncbi:MAG: hypothetical protein MOGMAGMI_01678 [Candidatus Omnitrophica bacterium]|nr:hypothetical protein [Candidatus Omnitrophota bacterium]